MPIPRDIPIIPTCILQSVIAVLNSEVIKSKESGIKMSIKKIIDYFNRIRIISMILLNTGLGLNYFVTSDYNIDFSEKDYIKCFLKNARIYFLPDRYDEYKKIILKIKNHLRQIKPVSKLAVIHSLKDIKLYDRMIPFIQESNEIESSISKKLNNKIKNYVCKAKKKEKEKENSNKKKNLYESPCEELVNNIESSDKCNIDKNFMNFFSYENDDFEYDIINENNMNKFYEF